MTTDNLCFYLHNRLIQTSKTGGQWYSDTSPFSIPWFRASPVHRPRRTDRRRRRPSAAPRPRRAGPSCQCKKKIIFHRRWRSGKNR